jgi:hypothetical protein
MPNLAITKKDALAHTAEIKREVGTAKKMRVRILRTIAASVDRREYEIAGFEDLAAWLEHVGIETSVSHFLRLLHNIRALKHVTDAQLEAMPEGNSHILARLPEKARRDPRMIQRAVSEKPAEFKAQLAGTVKQTPEGWKTFSLLVPEGVYGRLREAETKIARVLDLDLSDEEKRAGRLITVWESIAQLVNDTDESRLVVEMEGISDANSSDR